MSPDCERWIALSDECAVAGPLAPEELLFLARHIEKCAGCAAEARVYSELSGLLTNARDAHGASASGSDAHTARVPGGGADSSGAFDRTQKGASRFSHRRVTVLVALGLAAAAAAATLVAYPLNRTSSATNASKGSTETPSEPAGRVRVAERGTVLVDGKELAAGAVVREGARVATLDAPGCLTLDPGVLACFSPQSVGRLVSAGDARALSVERGRVVAELTPQPKGSSFAVHTRDGAVVAIGTAFSVEVPADASAPIVTRVLHGVVEVRAPSGSATRLRANTWMATGAGVEPLAPSDVEAEWRVVGLDGPTSPHDPSRDAPLGGADIVVPSGDRPGTEPSMPVEAAPESRQAPLSAPVSAPEAAPPGAEALLREARALRGKRDIDAARATYESLIRRHPASTEAHIALVALGELELDRAPDRALALFDRYLLRGGTLSEEALAGRVRALEALGRPAEAAQARAELARSFGVASP
jgi:hypothetical protein